MIVLRLSPELVRQLGGELECYSFMFRQYDGAVIANLPDSASAATIGVAVTGTDAFSRYETHELISTEEMLVGAKAAGPPVYLPGGLGRWIPDHGIMSRCQV